MIAADSRHLLFRSAQALLCGAEQVTYARINPDQQALSLVSVEEAVAPSDLDRAEQLVRPSSTSAAPSVLPAVISRISAVPRRRLIARLLMLTEW